MILQEGRRGASPFFEKTGPSETYRMSMNYSYLTQGNADCQAGRKFLPVIGIADGP